jgi:UDP-GlcNAc:undecaprenyl-phosphate GlcNAc-1-phosphate transferase
VDDPGQRKIHATPIPLAGGLAVFTGMLIVILGGCAAIKLRLLDPVAVDRLAYGFGKRAWEIASILLGGVGMLVLGWWDDRHELRPAWKLLGQVAVASLVAAAGVRVTLFVPSIAFSFLVTALWIVTVTNAFNLSDNMNGLCGGLACIAAAAFTVHAGLHGEYLVASLSAVTCGATLGFLPFNFPRASVFLGDAGSHLIGYMLSVLAILPHFYSSKFHDPRPWAVLIPVIVLIVPLADLATVTITRTLAGKPFWVGDTNHLSHRLVRAGLSRPRAVMVLWLAGLIAGLSVLA